MAAVWSIFFLQMLLTEWPPIIQHCNDVIGMKKEWRLELGAPTGKKDNCKGVLHLVIYARLSTW